MYKSIGSSLPWRKVMKKVNQFDKKTDFWDIMKRFPQNKVYYSEKVVIEKVDDMTAFWEDMMEHILAAEEYLMERGHRVMELGENNRRNVLVRCMQKGPIAFKKMVSNQSTYIICRSAANLYSVVKKLS